MSGYDEDHLDSWASNNSPFTITCQFGHHDDCPGEWLENDDDGGPCGCECHEPRVNYKRKTPDEVQLDEGPESIPTITEGKEIMTIIACDHRQDDVLAFRRVPVSTLPDYFDRDRIKSAPQGVIFYDSYDDHGNVIAAPWPDRVGTDDDYAPGAETLFPNDVVSGPDGVTHVYRGSYWIDELEVDPDGTEMALLHLGCKVRCPRFEWCSGHHIEHDGTLDLVAHMGKDEVLHTFSHPKIGHQAQQVRVFRDLDQEEGFDRLYVTIDVEASFDRAGLWTLALELSDVVDKLLERGSKLDKEAV